MIVRDPTALGAAIRDRRRRLGLDQGELARKVGVSRQWIVAVEQGKPRAAMSLVLRALAALGLALTIEPRSAPLPDRQGGPDGGRDIDLDAIVRAARRPPR